MKIDPQLFDLVELDKEFSSRSFADYLEIAWNQVESEDYIRGWHNDAICEHLQAVAEGQIKDLVINVPPGSTKSLSTNVFFPSWVWQNQPNLRFIFSSYSDTLGRRDSLKCRILVEDKWYQDRWGTIVEIDKKMEHSSKRFVLTKGGARFTTTVLGALTGEHCDIFVIDDPYKPQELVRGTIGSIENSLDVVSSWWRHTVPTRFKDKGTARRIIIMQRLHEADLAGEALKERGFEHLMLPMRFESKRKCYTSIFEDPRTEDGELLNETRWNEATVSGLEKELGARGAAAQLQQDPTPDTGGIFERQYARYYKKLPRVTNLIQSWDCTFKETEKGSFVVGQVWGVYNGDYYLVDQVRGRWGFSDTCVQIKKLTIKHPNARLKLIEDKANGPAVVDTLKRKISGFKLIQPEGGKIVRANAIQDLWIAGNIWLPDQSVAPWIDGFVEEIVGFDRAANDDQVDGMTQAIIFLESKKLGQLKKAMDNVRERYIRG